MKVQVLIDTWWNVNLTRSSKKKDGNSVLIDTWWNVNIIDTSKMTLNDIVLIDTWWNVNEDARLLLHNAREF